MKPRAAVLDDLRHAALAVGHDRRAAGERLDHHQSERLRPLDGEEGGPGAPVELALGLVVDLAAEVDVAGEVRFDLAREELALGPLVHLTGHDERRAQLLRHADRGVRPLVGRHAADEEEVVVFLCGEGLMLDVDGVRDGAHEVQLREAAALVVGDGDEGEVVAQTAEEALHLLVRRAVERGHHGRAGEAVDEGAHHPAREAVVVVDDVELVHPRVRLERVGDLEMAAVLDLLERGALEDRGEARLGPGVATGEQRDVVTALHQAFGEQRDHELDAAVLPGRQREPRRRDHPDPHPATPSDGGGRHAAALFHPLPHTPRTAIICPDPKGRARGGSTSGWYQSRHGVAGRHGKAG